MTTRPTPKPHAPPKMDSPGFGRDAELEQDRGKGRPAAAELDSDEAKADQEPILGLGLDPDLQPCNKEP